jgi:hypothetical protein
MLVLLVKEHRQLKKKPEAQDLLQVKQWTAGHGVDIAHHDPTSASLTAAAADPAEGKAENSSSPAGPAAAAVL